MRELSRREALGVGLVAVAAAPALLGADRPKSPLGLGSKKEPPLKIDETVGDLAYVRLVDGIRVEGAGLVIGLDQTGSNPSPSPDRSKVLNLMRAAQVEGAERILESKQTSLVTVRGAIPGGIARADAFDVVIELPADTGTTSLAGGFLIETELTFNGIGEDGKEHEGQVLAKVEGPVLIGSAGDPNDPKVGRVLGRAHVKKDMPHTLLIKEGRQSVRTAALLQGVVGARFYYLDGTDQKSVAQAMQSDQVLTLRVPQTYHQNQSRFFQLLQVLPIIDTPDLRAARMAAWGRELLDPRTAGESALKLEAIGPNAIPQLRIGLASSDRDVRYFAAEALAYLNDDSGVEILAEAARLRPEFRAFALAALAASDQQAGLMKLRDLLSEPEPQLRYGAFNAIRAVDERDYALGKTPLMRAEMPAAPDDENGGSMAYKIAVARSLSRREPDPFDLYVVDCDGPPMVHVSSARRAEVVLFGPRQKLLTPVVLGEPGSVLINASLSDELIEVSRLEAGDIDRPDATVRCRPELAEVVREAANLGADYPEIVAILRAAQVQKNLEGPLVMDALPAPDVAYEEAQLAATLGTGKGTDGDGKLDAEVGRASAEAKTGRPRFRLFERFRRNRDR